MPAARPIILASAMPTWKNRSGNSFLKSPIFMDPSRSAHKPTTLGFFLPASSRPAPKPERVSFFSVYVNFVAIESGESSSKIGLPRKSEIISVSSSAPANYLVEICATRSLIRGLFKDGEVQRLTAGEFEDFDSRVLTAA